MANQSVQDIRLAFEQLAQKHGDLSSLAQELRDSAGDRAKVLSIANRLEAAVGALQGKVGDLSPTNNRPTGQGGQAEVKADRPGYDPDMEREIQDLEHRINTLESNTVNLTMEEREENDKNIQDAKDDLANARARLYVNADGVRTDEKGRVYKTSLGRETDGSKAARRPSPNPPVARDTRLAGAGRTTLGGVQHDPDVNE